MGMLDLILESEDPYDLEDLDIDWSEIHDFVDDSEEEQDED